MKTIQITSLDNIAEAAKEFIAKWLKSSRAKELNKKSEILGRFEDLIKDLKEE